MFNHTTYGWKRDYQTCSRHRSEGLNFIYINTSYIDQVNVSSNNFVHNTKFNPRASCTPCIDASARIATQLP